MGVPQAAVVEAMGIMRGILTYVTTDASEIFDSDAIALAESRSSTDRSATTKVVFVGGLLSSWLGGGGCWDCCFARRGGGCMGGSLGWAGSSGCGVGDGPHGQQSSGLCLYIYGFSFLSLPPLPPPPLPPPSPPLLPPLFSFLGG